jgi:TolB protein
MKIAPGSRRARRTLAAGAMAAATIAATLAGPALAAQASPAGGVLGAGQVGSRAEVPWSKVGPGWALAYYSASQGGEGVQPKAGASRLYLVDPQGGRYSLAAFPARSAASQWQLQAWSGDTRRALLTSDGPGTTERVHQLQLRTGRISTFTLPANVSAIGYTRPDGLNILAGKGQSYGPGTLLRYNLAGQLQQTLAKVYDINQVASQPGGAMLAGSVRNGLELISNSGGVIRKLPVPGVRYGCTPVRWWTARTILASCTIASAPGPQLWLVPASGARPSALTPARTGPGFDAGDFNAWQLSSGLYLDGYGACGSLVIGRQPAHEAEQMVSVPGSASSLIVTATRSSLMVERINGCSPGISLVWFNPATRAMKVALPVRGHQYGVVGLVPYFVTGKF